MAHDPDRFEKIGWRLRSAESKIRYDIVRLERAFEVCEQSAYGPGHLTDCAVIKLRLEDAMRKLEQIRLNRRELALNEID